MFFNIPLLPGRKQIEIPGNGKRKEEEEGRERKESERGEQPATHHPRASEHG